VQEVSKGWGTTVRVFVVYSEVSHWERGGGGGLRGGVFRGGCVYEDHANIVVSRCKPLFSFDYIFESVKSNNNCLSRLCICHVSAAVIIIIKFEHF